MSIPAANETAQTLARQLSDVAREAPPQTVQAAARLLDAATERSGLDRFFAAVVDALVRFAQESDENALADHPLGDDALLHLLDRPELLADLVPRDPLAPARLRGLALKRQLLAAEGGVVSAQNMGAALGISRQAVDKRRRAGILIGLSLGRRGYAYPVWQVDLEGLPDILAELRGLDPWTQDAFMLAPNRWLDGASPLDALRHGNRDGVLTAARQYGDQIAS